ncbi:glycosyltransferase family 39 protein, partial [Candidatus Microgenomates bacterium]|nr:glycosyltransferase family 39 protein [Candidatus Microgenomates bacterium]
MKKIFLKSIKIIKSNWLFFLILAGGLFLRANKPYQWFMYTHDQDLAAWFIKDVVFDHHFRLIGQETSSKGIFIGPVFYYLQIPFYWLFNWDAKGSVWLPIIISVFSIWSYYFVFSKMFTKKIGLIASALFSFSYLIVFIEKEVAPTMPVMLWTVWFLYAVWLILKGKQKAYVLLGLLGGLIWDLNLALALLSPIVVLSQMFSKKKINFKYLFIGFSIFMTLMLPFFAFEARHQFQQTKSLVS